MTLEDEIPRLEGVQYAPGEEQRDITMSSKVNEAAGPKKKWRLLWICLMVKIKSNAIKNNIA